jgi:hypothetical protein
MKIVLAFALLWVPLSGYAEPASPASVERLLAVAHTEELFRGVQERQRVVTDSVLRQVEASRARQGRPLSPEAQARMRAAAEKARAAMLVEMGWDKLRPLIVQVYSESFSEEEIQGLIAFYESPTGRMFVERMPQVTERTMRVIGERMGPMMQRLQRSIIEDASIAPAAPSPALSASPGASATPATPSTAPLPLR